MPRRVLIILGIVLATAVILKIIYWISPMKESRVIIRDEKIIVEVARTQQEFALGLSGRLSLPSNHGMLFILSEKQIPKFWMKGMFIPLDMIWIADGRIVDMTQNVLPPPFGAADDTLPLYSPKEPATTALEVNAGSAERFGWKVGDRVEVEL